MISAVYGRVMENRADGLQLRVGPVTLEMAMPAVQAAELRVGTDCQVHTYLHFSSSADQLRLFGFTSAAGRDLFATLISGSGVGPKVALALLELGVPGLVAAVRDGDEKALTSVSGVGPKLAKKVILELSDKVAKEFAGISPAGEAGAKNKEMEDALDAVVALGFPRLHAERALHELIAEVDREDTAAMIRLILTKISGS